MAGGSADAAAALVALDRLWETETSDEDLLALAAAARQRRAVRADRRDRPRAPAAASSWSRSTDPGTWWWVVVPDPVGLSTPEVYRHFDRLFPGRSRHPAGGRPAAGRARRRRTRTLLAAALHNDLQPAAFDLRPDLEKLIDRGEAAGALRGMVTGSGPTCVFLCRVRRPRP